MTTIITTLIFAGVLAGLVNYFVDIRGLKIFLDEKVKPAMENETVETGFWNSIKEFLKANWEFFGCITTGITGAFLVPLINELVPLNGLSKDCDYSTWRLPILLGYGIVSGYSSVRIIRSLGTALIGKMVKSLNDQVKINNENANTISALKQEVENLTTRLK